ncbi:MAG: MMPL family transporter [candidate division WOR-3 bacterium]
MEKLILKNSKYTIILTLLLTLLMGFFALKLKINPNVIDYLPEDEQIVRNFKRIGTEYGGSLTGLIVYENDRIFSKRSLEEINLITKKLEEIEGINRVNSLTNIVDIKSENDDILIKKVLSMDSLNDQNYLFDKEKIFLEDEFFKKKFLSEDAKKSLIILFFADNTDQQKVCAKIKKLLRDLDLKGKLYYGGLPFLLEEVGNLILKDILKLILPCLLLMIFILGISYRSFEGVFIPLLNSFISIVVVFGLMSILKVKVTIISNIIPIILIAVGSAYSIHFVSKVYEEESKNQKRKESIENSFKEIFLPVFLAALTTFIGFMSFVGGSYLLMIKEFGIFSAIGVLVSFILSVTFAPSLMVYTKKKNKFISDINGDEKFKIFADGILKLRKPLTLFVIVLFLGSISVLPKISRSADIINYFNKKAEFRISNDMIEKNFGGSSRFLILAKGNMNYICNLKEVENLENFIRDSLGIENTNSIVQVIKRMNFIIENERKIPDNDEKLSNLYFLLEGEKSLNRLIKNDKSETVIEASFPNGLSLDKVKKLLFDLERGIKSIEKNVKFEVTGMPSIYVELDQTILRSTVLSTSLSLVLILILHSIVFKSIKKGIKGVVPIFVTIICIYGLMSLLKIPLDIATNLIGSIAVGIGIDYSIHYMIRMKHEQKKNNDFKEVRRITLLTTGKAILTNVLTVAAGFAILILSNLKPLSNFGLLIMLTMLIAGFSTVIILSNSLKEKE